jgi:hypothetical protein
MPKPDQRSAAAQAYRAWYKTPQWRKLRRRRLEAEPLCRTCRRLGRTTPATIVDHIRAHKGDAGLFFAFGNTASMCQPHHDSNKQRAERGIARVAVGADGWPL